MRTVNGRKESVSQAVEMAVMMSQAGVLPSRVPDYIEENVSLKVVKIIQSYVGIVNQTVWKKHCD